MQIIAAGSWSDKYRDKHKQLSSTNMAAIPWRSISGLTKFLKLCISCCKPTVTIIFVDTRSSRASFQKKLNPKLISRVKTTRVDYVSSGIRSRNVFNFLQTGLKVAQCDWYILWIYRKSTCIHGVSVHPLNPHAVANNVAHQTSLAWHIPYLTE